MQREDTQPAEGDRVALLSPRERQILGMVAQGLTNVEVSRRLDVTVHAVKFHLASIYHKLGVGNRTEAAVTYLRSGALIAPASDYSKGV
jgi:DNA-binding CsgD family transcriptional regulator